MRKSQTSSPPNTASRSCLATTPPRRKTITGVELKLTNPKSKAKTEPKKGTVWVRGGALSPRSVGPYKDVEPIKGKKKKKGEEEIRVGGFDKEGWYRTGDLGKIDRYQRLTLTGREDDVVKVEGKRVALGEVEGCIEAFPSVKEAQALLVSDPYSGAMVVAKVVAAGKLQAEDIIDHCARNLAPYKVPRRIEFCDSL
jgi:acyl-CoA synthetase (AMP-forming)/AMP-acid ligase II